MVRFLLRWAINAIALYAAVRIIDSTVGGIQLQNPNWQTFIWIALIFGLVNALLRPFISVLTCPLIILTLGLFTLVINTFLFWLVGWLGTFFGVGYTIDNVWIALLGSIIVSIVSIALSLVLRDQRRPAHRKNP